VYRNIEGRAGAVDEEDDRLYQGVGLPKPAPATTRPLSHSTHGKPSVSPNDYAADASESRNTPSAPDQWADSQQPSTCSSENIDWHSPQNQQLLDELPGAAKTSVHMSSIGSM